MAISFTNLGASTTPDINSATNAISYASGSWTPPTSGVVCIYIYSRSNVGAFADPTVTGNGMTWVKISRQDDGGSNFDAIWLYAALAIGSPTTGATTINFGTGNTQASCVAEFFQIEGGNTRRPNGLADMFINFHQVAAATGTTSSITYDAAEHADNRPIACSYHAANEATTFRTNWTEGDDLAGTNNNRGVETQWRSDTFETTGSASWSTSSTRLMGGCEVVSDTAPTAFTKTVTNTVGLTDTIGKVATFFRTLANTIGLTDLVEWVHTPAGGDDWTYSISNTVGLTDAISKTASFIRTLTNTVGLSDTVSKAVSYVRTLSHTIGLTDVVSGIVSTVTNWTYTITDVVGITDSLRKAFVVISRTTLNGLRNLYNTIRGSIK